MDEKKTSSSMILDVMVYGVLFLLFGLALGMVWCENAGFTEIFDADYNVEAAIMGYNNYDNENGNNIGFVQFAFGGITQLFFLITSLLFFRAALKLRKGIHKQACNAFIVAIISLLMYVGTCYMMESSGELPIYDQFFYTFEIYEINAQDDTYFYLFSYIFPVILMVIAAYAAHKLKVPIADSATDGSYTASANGSRPSTSSGAGGSGSATRSSGTSSQTATGGSRASGAGAQPPVVVGSSGGESAFTPTPNGKPARIRKLSVDGGKYIGEVRKGSSGKTVPYGVGTWENKREYSEGCWVDGLRHGTATVWTKSGITIRGEWNHGVMHGWFCYDYPDGYEFGPMYEGEKHGVWYHKNSDPTFWNHGNRVSSYSEIEQIVAPKAEEAVEAEAAVEEPTVSSSDNVLAGLIPGMEFASTESAEEETEDEDIPFDVSSIGAGDSKEEEEVEFVPQENNDSDEDIPFVPQSANSREPENTAIGAAVTEPESRPEPAVRPEPVAVAPAPQDDSRRPSDVVGNAQGDRPVFAFCPYCGSKMTGKFFFCPFCGSKF